MTEKVKAPEDLIQAKIDYHSKEFKRACSEKNVSDAKYHDGYIDGVLETLKTLGVKRVSE